jgi:hypothetical protein
VTLPGTYYVTVTNAFNCSGRDTVVVNHVPFTPVNLGPDINVCQASAVLDAGPGYTSYSWNNGSTAQSITVVTGGTYSVTVTGAGGCSNSDAINVTFAPVTFSLGNDTTFCEPGYITLDPQLTGNFNYNWSTGATTPTLTLNSPATHNVALTVTNAFSCSASDTVVVDILPTPPSLIGGDTILCADTSVTLNAGPGFATYAWSTGATSQSIVASAGGVYRVTATAPNGCVRGDTIMISGLIDCVFPGDVDYDGTADVMDVLALATAMGVTGSQRANASLQWYGQHAWSWGGSIALGANFKQGDTDGNGVIQQLDTLAIQNNYGSTHTKVGDVTGGAHQVRIVPLSNPVAAGGMARFAVFYEGSNGQSAQSLHGIAMRITWPSNLVSGQGLHAIDFSNAWFAPANNRMTFTRMGNNTADIALTRISGTDTSGYGMAMVLTFAIDSNLAPGSTASFAPTVTMAQGVGISLLPETATPQVTPVTLLGPAVYTGPTVISHISIGPIPAAEYIQVHVEGKAPVRLRMIDMLGKIVLDTPWNVQDEYKVDVTSLPAGNYCIQLQMETDVIVKMVTVNH